MSNNMSNQEDEEDEDELIARIQEESLRYYQEVELPRINSQILQATTSKEEEFDILCTQVRSKSLLYEGEEAKGFHLAAGHNYIYPTNYPVRQYQSNIVQSALFKNTLVSLPTGLGKTFIAAVVMYNFYRWYPCGKVVFMAPTRPLVAQQIKACHHIMNIPAEDTIEMTGTMPVQQRVAMWREKRVFFLTPQVMVNDLLSQTCPPLLIKCLVVDEAHRAVKDYAYCQVVKQLEEGNAIYRILALSATPGNDVNAVQQVVRNLKISCLELRGEDAIDVAPYTHSRSVDCVVLDLSINIQRVKQDFLQIYEKYARKLKDFKALSSNIATISKFQILKACEKFRSNPPRNLPPTVVGGLVSDFTVCMSLAHALDLLQTYGLRAFYNYLTDEHSDKGKAAATRIRNDGDLKKMLERLKNILILPPGKEGYTWGHPKYQKLAAILSEHFAEYEAKEESTRAIVFCEYRVVVTEVVELLSSIGPHVRPVMFVGQSGGKERGMPQAKQLQIMKSFRSGEANVLVSTCVGEEGLDVGEVDLILLCEAHKSLTRMVQRIGRTGRKRKGQCVVLLTKGKEQQKFNDVMASRKSYVSNILNSAGVRSSLFQSCPSMLPPDVRPEKEFVHIKPDEIVTPVKGPEKKQVDIRNCLVVEDSPYLTEEEFQQVFKEVGKKKLNFNRIPPSMSLWPRQSDKRMVVEELLKKDVARLSDWLDWNKKEQPFFEIEHSIETKLFCSLIDPNRPKPNLQFNPYLDYRIEAEENSSDEEYKVDQRKRKGNLVEGEESTSDSDLSDIVVGPKRARKQPGKTKKEVKENCMDIRKFMGGGAKSNKPVLVDEVVIDLVESPDLYLEIVEQLNNALKIDIKRYENLDLRCCFDKNEEMCEILDKYSGRSSSRVDWLKCEPLPDLEFLKDVTAEAIKSLDFSGRLVQENNVEDFYVSIDDLFGDEDNILPASPSRSTKIMVWEKTPDYLKDFGSPDIFKSARKISSSTPNRSPKAIQPKKLDKLPEEEEVDTWNARKISSSTPNRSPKASRSPLQPKKLDTLPEEEDVDVWNVSDLFQEEENKTGAPQDSTLLGLTQLASLIERSRRAKCLPSPSNKNDPSVSDNKTPDRTSSPPPSEKSSDMELLDLDEIFDKHSPSSTCKNETSALLNKSCNHLKRTQSLSPEKSSDMELLDFDEIFDKYSPSPSNENEISVSHNKTDAKRPPSLDYEKATAVSEIKSLNCLDTNHLEKSADIELLDLDNIFDQIEPPKRTPVPEPQPSTSGVKKNFKKFEGRNKKPSLEKSSYEEVGLCVLDVLAPPLGPLVKKFGLSLKKSRVVKSSELPSVPRPQAISDGSEKFDFKEPEIIVSEYFSQPDEESFNIRPTNKKQKRRILSSEEDNSSNDEEGKSEESFVGSQNVQRYDLPSPVQSTDISFLTPPKKKPKDNDNFRRGVVNKNIINLDSDEEDVFESSTVTVSLVDKTLIAENRKKRKRKKTHKAEFVELEADESGIISTDDEDDSDLDQLDQSFIDDQSFAVDINNKYLESIRSPARGRFKIPEKKSYPMDVYSQYCEPESEYVNDSFCVESDGSSESEPSLLELAERKLAKRRKKRRAEDEVIYIEDD